MDISIKAGDRVVCLEGSDLWLVKGKHYICYDVISFPCGCKGLDVGINRGDLSKIVLRCNSCDKLHKPQGYEQYFNSNRFEKVEESVNYVKLEVKTQKPCLN